MSHSGNGKRRACGDGAEPAYRRLNARWAFPGRVTGFALLACTACNIYDSTLLNGSGGHSGDGGATGQSGTAGLSGDQTGGGSSGDAAGSGATDDGGAPEAGGGTDSTSGSTGMGGSTTTAGSPGVAGSTTMGGNVGMAGSSGGRAGAGGTAGMSGGTAGKGGSGGSPSAGSAGMGGASATGCARLSVPLDATTDKAHFVISVNTPIDLSHATISTHLYVQAGAGGSIFNYVQDSGTFHFLGVPPAQRHELSSFSGWYTLTWNVGAEPDAGTGIVKTSIKNIGLEISAQPSSFWSDPTIIYIDSLTITNPTLSLPFDATASVFPSATTSADPLTLWLNSNPADTTSAGVTLRWQATCP